MISIIAVLIMLKAAVMIFVSWQQWRVQGKQTGRFVFCAIMTALDVVVIKACYAVLTRGGI